VTRMVGLIDEVERQERLLAGGDVQAADHPRPPWRLATRTAAALAS